MTFTYRLVSGTFQLTISNGVARLLSVVTMPVLTAWLSPQAYGVASLVGTLISLASVFALVGIDVSYTRAYFSTKQPSGTSVERYCWRFATLMSLLAAVFVAIAWWMTNRHSNELDQRLAILLALGVVFSVASTMAQTRARLAGSYRALSLTIIATGVATSAASIGIALWWRQDALALLLPMVLGYLMPTVLLGAPSISELKNPSGLTSREGAALIKIGLAGIITAPMYWLLSSSDRWFLQHYQGAEAVGIYSIGYNVAMVGMMVNTAVMAVWLPEASREYEHDQIRARTTLGTLMSRMITAMALIWLMATAAGGDIVHWLANERFHSSAEFVPFIAAGVFFYGVSQLALYGLVLVNQFKWAALWWFVGGLVCTLLNVTLVSRHGGLGAAMTQGISFALIFIGILATSQYMYPLQLSWIRLATVMVIIVAAGVFLASSWHANAPISLLLKLPIGIAIAFVAGWIVAPDWCARGIDYFRRDPSPQKCVGVRNGVS